MSKKKFLSMILAAAMSLSAVSAMSAGVSAEWVKSSSGYSYKDDSTGKKLTGWQTIGSGKYYFNSKGIALTGWKKINGDTYYFNAAKKGKAITSWATIGDSKYYFGNDGVMRTGWIKLSGKTYYFGNDGKMRTGKLKINGKTYNFGKDGVLKSSTTSTKTKSSSLSGLKIDYAVKGMDFGMSKKQVIQKMPYEDYLTQNSMIIAIPEDEKYMVVYVMDTDNELCAYGYMAEDSSLGFSTFKKLFTNAEWLELGEQDGNIVYCSPDYTSFGIVMNADGDYAAIVYSGELLEAYLSGDTSAIDNLMY